MPDQFRSSVWAEQPFGHTQKTLSGRCEIVWYSVSMSAANTMTKVASQASTAIVNASLGAVEASLLSGIARSGRAVIRVDRERELFRAFTPKATRQALQRLERGGWLRRIERGTYVQLGASRLDTRSTLALVADWLEGMPYAVAGTAALAHWNLSGHAPSVVDILVARQKRAVEYRGIRFVFHLTDPALFDDSGAVLTMKIEGARVPLRIVGPERALLDAARGVHALPLGVIADAFDRGLRFGSFNRRRLVAQARRDPVAARRIGWLAEQRHEPLADALASLVGRGGYVLLDPRGPADAPFNRRWRVTENATYDDLLG